MFKLDIDRLHKVFHGELNGIRACGKTTAVCYQAIGFIEVENKDIYILLECENYCRYFIYYFQEILELEGYIFSIDKRDRKQFNISVGDTIKKVCVCTINTYTNYNNTYPLNKRSDFYDILTVGGRGYKDHILLFDFEGEYYGGFNSAQFSWGELINAENQFWINNTKYR